MNVGVATTIPAFPGFPLGVTAGTYTSPIFDLTQPLIYNPAFITLQGGLPQAEAALIAGLLNSETYLNIHTALNGGGEIRGILSPAVPVPEPGTLSMLGLGITGVIAARKRRRDFSIVSRSASGRARIEGRCSPCAPGIGAAGMLRPERSNRSD
jgi:hypothetical protein